MKTCVSGKFELFLGIYTQRHMSLRMGRAFSPCLISLNGDLGLCPGEAPGLNETVRPVPLIAVWQALTAGGEPRSLKERKGSQRHGMLGAAGETWRPTKGPALRA